MRRKLTIVGCVLVSLVCVGFALISMIEPDFRPASDVPFDPKLVNIEHGEYLTKNVLGCLECHSKRDWNKYGGPMVPPYGGGGTCYTEKHGIPGYTCPSNITSDRESGIGQWTTGEIMRAIREGVNDRNHALFPLMPYPGYRTLSDADTMSVVAYIQTLKAAENFVPQTFLQFPVNIFIKLKPEPLSGPVQEPSVKQGAEYGKYLVTIAGCEYCHSSVDRQKDIIENKRFAGGQVFAGPWGEVISPNITPHTTGIKEFTREGFIELFKTFAAESMSSITVDPGSNTVMPWITYGGMTREDLGSIYDYLMTLTPVDSDSPNRMITSKIIADGPNSEESPTPASEKPHSAGEGSQEEPQNEDIEEGADEEEDDFSGDADETD